MSEDTSQHVYILRPPGRQCANSHCPYNDNAYDQHRPEAYDGLCLNCIDDADHMEEH